MENLGKQAFRYGGLGGVFGLYLALVGLLGASSKRAILALGAQPLVSLAHVLLVLAIGVAVFLLWRRQPQASGNALLGAGALAGAVSGLVIGLLPFLGQWINFRYVFINASPELYAFLRWGQDPWLGLVVMVLFGALVGLVTVGLLNLPQPWRRAVARALAYTALVGLLSDLLRRLAIRELLYPFVEVQGVNPLGALLVIGLTLGWEGYFRSALARWRSSLGARPVYRVLGHYSVTQILWVTALLYLPYFVGSYLSDVLVTVGLFTLMGLGLNIVVGFAGLLDLGYVAFFAIGAYTTAVLTSESPLGVADWSFWAALPVAVLAAMVAGILLGMPVLRLRGDYLAIVTLGFGEIIRLLATSDWLKPYIGGAQGILLIPGPELFGFRFSKPQHYFYLVLLGIVAAWFVAVRLRDSRLGRAWMAIREDEDVAEAMGINLVSAKLLAFAFGASFSGIAGAIFAAKVGSIFPHSFHLLISINVLALIIVGGIGSLPGVVVGSLLLVGLPELLREFAEYRLLVYGFALIAMMLLKPEGFWPEPVRQRELHAEALSSD